MKKLLYILTAAFVVVTIASPAFAREVKTIVGYITTETVTSDQDAMFYKIDESKDGAINFKEFQKAAMLVNEYEMFNMNDTNNDDLLSLDEYRNFSKEGPAHIKNDASSTNYNFNNKRVE